MRLAVATPETKALATNCGLLDDDTPWTSVVQAISVGTRSIAVLPALIRVQFLSVAEFPGGSFAVRAEQSCSYAGEQFSYTLLVICRGVLDL